VWSCYSASCYSAMASRDLRTPLEKQRRRGPASRTMLPSPAAKAPDASPSGSKHIAEAIRNASKQAAASPTSPAVGKSTRATRTAGKTAASPGLNPKQVAKLESVFLERPHLGKAERRVLAANLQPKLTEVQVQHWFDARRAEGAEEGEEGRTMKEIQEFINKPSTPPAKATPGGRKVRGVVASKLPAEDVEIVDILDDSMDEGEEPSLMESPMLRSTKEEVKLTMIRAQAKAATPPDKAAKAPKTTPKAKPGKAKAADKPAEEKEQLVDELMTRIDQLEADLKTKSDEVVKTKTELVTKSGIEKTLAEKEKALKQMPKVLEDHKKALAKKEREAEALKEAKEQLEEELNKVGDNKKETNKDHEVEKAKNKALQIENKELKSKVQEIKLIKDDEMKTIKAESKDNMKAKDVEIKSLKTDLKKTLASKEEEIKALKVQMKTVKDGGEKALHEERKKEVKAMEEDFKKKLKTKDDEVEARLRAKSDDILKKLDKKDKEVKEKISKKETEFTNTLKLKEDQFNAKVKEVEVRLASKEGELNGKIKEGQAMLATKEEEVGKMRATVEAKENEVAALVQRERSSAGVEEQRVEAERRAEQTRREVLDLKSYQRKLEAKVEQMEEEVFMARAQGATQARVRDGLVEKVQAKEKELKGKEEQLAKLAEENKEHVAKAERVEAERAAAVAEAGAAKLKLQAAAAEEEEEEFNLSGHSVSPMYARNTPFSRRHRPSHRLPATNQQAGEAEQVEEARLPHASHEEEATDARHSVSSKRPLPFPLEEAKRRRVVEEEEELGEEDVAILLNTCEEGEDLEMAEEDITKLLDTSVTEAEMAVAAAMEKVLEGVMEEARVAAAILELLQM